MENKEILMIPFVAHESAMNRMERTNEKLMKVIKFLIALIALIIIGITVYLCLPTEVEKVEQDVNNVKDSQVNQKVGK